MHFLIVSLSVLLPAWSVQVEGVMCLHAGAAPWPELGSGLKGFNNAAGQPMPGNICLYSLLFTDKLLNFTFLPSKETQCVMFLRVTVESYGIVLLATNFSFNTLVLSPYIIFLWSFYLIRCKRDTSSSASNGWAASHAGSRNTQQTYIPKAIFLCLEIFLI